MRKPRIAVILDENTSGDASRYEAAKGYFRSVGNAGGLPLGVPYLPEVIDVVLNEFDGFLAVGGRFAYPDDWYRSGEVSKAPPSDRLDIERALMEGCLALDKPVLGICAGMQMLACLNGCKLTSDLRATMPNTVEHDMPGRLHAVHLRPGSRLATIIGHETIEVNTFHREAVAEVRAPAMASAHSDDGVVEAIELRSHSFAIGIQWHQELLTGNGHPGDAIFRAFIDAA